MAIIKYCLAGATEIANLLLAVICSHLTKLTMCPSPSDI